MDYQIMPMGEIWSDGMFSVPSKISKKYIKFASEYQLKALLLILSQNGKASARDIAKALGCTESDADDFLDFWVEEGIIIKNNEMPEKKSAKKENASSKKEEKEEHKEKTTLESIPAPVLNKKELTEILDASPEAQEVVQVAQEIFGGPISLALQIAAVNMVYYYGLPGEVVLTILQYYKSERDKKKPVGIAYLNAMAKNWSEEGITTLDAAEEKISELENSNDFWKEILDLASIKYRAPSVKQRAVIKEWKEDFSIELIGYACEIMKENASTPSIKYLEKILKNWKKAGIKTIDEAKADSEKHTETKNKNTPSRLKGAPSFDIKEIEQKAIYDDDYDI